MAVVVGVDRACLIVCVRVLVVGRFGAASWLGRRRCCTCCGLATAVVVSAEKGLRSRRGRSHSVCATSDASGRRGIGLATALALVAVVALATAVALVAVVAARRAGATTVHADGVQRVKNALLQLLLAAQKCLHGRLVLLLMLLHLLLHLHQHELHIRLACCAARCAREGGRGSTWKACRASNIMSCHDHLFCSCVGAWRLHTTNS